jgi:hypothetical protein
LKDPEQLGGPEGENSQAETSEEKTMNYIRQQMSPARFVLLSILCLAALVSWVKFSRASVGTITKADLSGAWQVSLVLANSGCGPMSVLVNFTLNSTGSATNATLVSHGSCGDSTVTGQTFTITSLNSNGSGMAGLSCGASCGWTFNIQVTPDRSVFNLVDVASANPGNFLGGVAIHQ